MVSDSWEAAPILKGDAVICQDQCEAIMEGQMSIVLALHMIFGVGLTKNQHGEIPIGSH